MEEQQKKQQGILEKGPTPELLKSQGLLKKQIEQLEAQLYALYEEFESAKKKFELLDDTERQE